MQIHFLICEIYYFFNDFNRLNGGEKEKKEFKSHLNIFLSHKQLIYPIQETNKLH